MSALTDLTVRSLLRLAAWIYYRNPDQADWIYEKVHRPSTLWVLARNIWYFQRGIPRVHALISVNIEPSFGCNLRCKYCWGAYEARLRGLRPPLMNWELFSRILDVLPPTVETITLGSVGEPLLNPLTPKMIHAIHAAGRRACLYTNGVLLKGEKAEALAASPLSVLNISMEPDAETAREYRGVNFEEILENARQFRKIRNPMTRIQLSVVLHKDSFDKIALLSKSWKDVVDGIKCSPMIKVDVTHTRDLCSELWRGNLNVFTNGEVSPCCFDLYGDLCVGNIQRETFTEILAGQTFRNLLQQFVEGNLPNRCLHCQEVPISPVWKRIPRRCVGNGLSDTESPRNGERPLP